MSLFLQLFALCFLPWIAAGADQFIQGENGSWKGVWHGVDFEQAQARKLPRACPIVARAIEAATAGDFTAFCKIFLDVDATRPPAQVAGLFKEWKRISARYRIIIAQEAWLTGEEATPDAAVVAISVVPNALRMSEQWSGNPEKLAARVVFARQVGDDWKLLAATLDRAVEQALLKRAGFLVHRERDFSKGEVAGSIVEFRESILAGMRRNGASLGALASKKADFQIEDDRATITNWAQWTNYFKAVVLDPPVAFDLRNASWLVDFSNPISALRSWKLALYVGDWKSLLKHADASGAEWLRKAGIRENSTNASFHIVASNKLTRVTILMTGTMRVGGRHYVMVLWRAETDPEPSRGFVELQTTIFVREHDWVLDKDRWVFTADLKDSALGGACSAAGLRHYGLWPDGGSFRRELEQSLFPAHFYALR